MFRSARVRGIVLFGYNRTDLTYLVGGSSWEYFPSQTGQQTPMESSADDEWSRTGNRRSFIM